MLKDLDENSFKKKIFDYEQGDDAKLLISKNTILEFWVTWCPHCQNMMPRYEKISKEHPEIDCYRIEMEQHPTLANVFNVEGFPTFIFINKNGDMKKWEGETSIEDMENMIDEIF